MIFGIGSDIIYLSRVAKVWQRFGMRFARRILTPHELEGLASSLDPPRFLARRFAAKEAMSKALGTGFAHGISPRRLGVRADARGKPCVDLMPEAAAIAARLGAGAGFLTLTDERDLVVAVAIFERR